MKASGWSTRDVGAKRGSPSGFVMIFEYQSTQHCGSSSVGTSRFGDSCYLKHRLVRTVRPHLRQPRMIPQPQCLPRQPVKHMATILAFSTDPVQRRFPRSEDNDVQTCCQQISQNDIPCRSTIIPTHTRWLKCPQNSVCAFVYHLHLFFIFVLSHVFFFLKCVF